MTKPALPTDAFTPKDWTARWVISLTTPLYSLRMRCEIDASMRLFARRMPEYHSVVMAGPLGDIIASLSPRDPFRNLYKDEQGMIRLPGGEPFGSWHNNTDLMPASNADIGRDISLAPMAEGLSDSSIELFYLASKSWESAREYLLSLCLDTDAELSPFETAEDAIRWALLRRQAYGVDGDGFFSVTATAWVKRTSAIVAGEPYDEARMMRLRSGASIPSGTYEELTGRHQREVQHPLERVGDE